MGQAGAALGAATGQDLAAVSGSHSLAEAVDLLAVELLGLIGTFRSHVETPPVKISLLFPGKKELTRHPDGLKMGAVILFGRVLTHRRVYHGMSMDVNIIFLFCQKNDMRNDVDIQCPRASLVAQVVKNLPAI